MKKIIIWTLALSAFVSCTEIKNKNTEVLIEEGTEVKTELSSQDESDPSIKSEIPEVEPLTNISSKVSSDARLGFWVGYFEEDAEDGSGKYLEVDEGYYWNRDNKINISIDRIEDSLVFGHSVVAGNDRPFEGVLDGQTFVVTEPGDDKYDGTFKFTIVGDELNGTWKAYKKIDIQKRKYKLEQKEFEYDPSIMLEYTKRYIDWSDFQGEEMDEDFILTGFASATDLIYEINASNTILKKEDVENLKKGDLLVIRNTIYARHGYSFKSRPLRVFFDAQGWYIPVHTDIKADFTELEKKNIELLLRYEKNAAEYYDYFGRG